jgi:hypothetical protein
MQTQLLEITHQAQDLIFLPNVTYDRDALLTHYRDYRVAVVVHDQHLALVAYRGAGGDNLDIYNRTERCMRIASSLKLILGGVEAQVEDQTDG